MSKRILNSDCKKQSSESPVLALALLAALRFFLVALTLAEYEEKAGRPRFPFFSVEEGPHFKFTLMSLLLLQKGESV